MGGKREPTEKQLKALKKGRQKLLRERRNKKKNVEKGIKKKK